MSNSKPSRGPWEQAIYDEAEVWQALEEGRMDGCLGAGWVACDELLTFLLSHGWGAWMEQVPDARQRRTIPASCLAWFFFLKQAMGALCPYFSRIPGVLFALAVLMARIGLTEEQMRGGARSHGGTKPFNEEAVEEWGVLLGRGGWLVHWKAWMEVVWRLIGPAAKQGVDILLDGWVWAVQQRDGTALSVRVLVAVVLGPWGRLPLLWLPDVRGRAEIRLARMAVWLLRRYFPGKVRRLIMDAGMIDGPWMERLVGAGIIPLVHLRSDMVLWGFWQSLAEKVGASWVWEEEELPKRPVGQEVPEQREVARHGPVSRLWEGCAVAWYGLIIRDTYADGRVEYDIWVSPEDLPASVLYSLKRDRWEIEEFFMQEERWEECQPRGVHRPYLVVAMVHFQMLAAAALTLFTWKTGRRPLDRPEYADHQQVVIFVGRRYAVLTLEELLMLVIRNVSAWRKGWGARAP